MNRWIAVRVLLSVSILATVSQAQVASNQPVTQHIVTLSFNAAVLQTAEAQNGLGALQAKLAPRQAQLQPLNNEVEATRLEQHNPTEAALRREAALRARMTMQAVASDTEA